MYNYHIFPFDEVDKNSKVIIYCAGKVCKQYLDQIMQLNYCQILFIVDRNYQEINNIYGIKVNSPEEIANKAYDKIVIANESERIIEEIYDALLCLNIPTDKIVKKITISQYDNWMEHIIIREVYSPKHRESLKQSKIRDIIGEWYVTNKTEVLALAGKLFSYKQNYQKIPFSSCSDNNSNNPLDLIQWVNGLINPLDAISVYGFVALNNPRYYVEVGSGNTTLFAAKAISDNNLRTKIISIDPYPRRDIDKICHEIYRIPLEDIDTGFFNMLTNEDILLIDNSHRSFPNSDVTVFFTEILPKLPSGIIYTIHDIFLPNDYPDKWSREAKAWYNEQYLMCMYLLGGAGGDKIKFPVCYLSEQAEFISECDSLWGSSEIFNGIEIEGAFFWMEKS